MFLIAYAFKGQVHVFAGQAKMVSHLSCRTSAVIKYFCPLTYRWPEVFLPLPILFFSSSPTLLVRLLLEGFWPLISPFLCLTHLTSCHLVFVLIYLDSFLFKIVIKLFIFLFHIYNAKVFSLEFKTLIFVWDKKKYVCFG